MLSDVGSEPAIAELPPKLSRTLYTRLSDVLKKKVESNRFVAPEVVVLDELTLCSYISNVLDADQSLRGIANEIFDDAIFFDAIAESQV